jgi:hypothetical protein
MKNKAQQEMVGFVLIVVLVMVGMMVLLIVMLKSPKINSSLEVDNMLHVIMKTTTNCVISSGSRYETIEDLFISCHENRRCNNLNQQTCDYLNSTLSQVLLDIMKTEGEVEAYQFEFSPKDESHIIKIRDGNCTSKITSVAQRSIRVTSTELQIKITLCKKQFD